MVDYATSANLTTHYGATEVLLAFDRDGDGTADPGVIAEAITNASQEIDTYLGARYTLPLATVPAILVSVCCEIAMYRASSNCGSVTDEKRKRYEDAVKWLKDVSKGIATLGVTEDSETAEDYPEVSSVSEERLFSRTKLMGLL